MRNLILFFQIFLVGLSFGQFTISTGISVHNDDFFGPNQNFNLGKKSLNNYNLYQLQFDYAKSTTRVYAEVGYLTSNFELEQNTSYSHGGGSSASYSDYRTYHSRVTFGYLSNKLGLGIIAISKNRNKLWGSFSCNMFAKLDRLMAFSESEQVMYRTTSSNNNMSQTFVTTKYPADYSPYNLISFNKFVFQFGTELDLRVGYKNYFFGLSAALGLCNKVRTFRNSSVSYSSEPYQTSLWSFNAGIKVGYLFQKKIKEKPTTQLFE